MNRRAIHNLFNGDSMATLTREHLNMIEAKRVTVVDIARITGISKQEITQMLKKYAEENKKAKSQEDTLFRNLEI
jgi:hypothetical protein